MATFLEASNDATDPGLVQALHEVTEGHPLFVVEVARLWKSQGARDHAGRPALPSSVRQAIQERLQSLSAPCRETIEHGAVVGREFDAALLAESDDSPGDPVEACLEARDASVLIEIGPQRFRFSHFLIRELIYDSIEPDRRRATHVRIARALEARPDGRETPRWSEVAHHFSAGGEAAARDATRAYRNACAQALEQLAFDEAVAAGERALALGQTLESDRETSTSILIELGHARTRAGDIEGGKRECVRAAAEARTTGDANAFARAALEHGSALIFAMVDQELVALLKEALQRLDESDSALRARVMARLAAALQPAFDPPSPIELARDAIAMAKRVGDRSALLDTLRNGGSTMVDVADPEERLAVDREHAALAEELDNPIEALRGNMRSFMDFAQLGRLDDAYRTSHACERAANELGHPAYRWRCEALRAIRALWEGDFSTAANHIEEVGELGERSRDPNARRTFLYQKSRLLQLRGDFEAQWPLVEQLDRTWRGTDFGDATANVLIGGELALIGRPEEALRYFDPQGIRRLVQLGDASIMLAVARLCAVSQDHQLAERAYKKAILSKENLVTTGMLGLTVEGPASWALALLARALGRNDEAKEHYEHGLARSRRTGGRPANASIGCEYAEFLAAEPGGAQGARVSELARAASANRF